VRLADTSDMAITLEKYLTDVGLFRDVHIKSALLGGTLGLFFEALLDDEHYIIKTHRPGTEYRVNLEKECEFVQMLYGEYLFTQKVVFDIGEGEKQVFLIMPKLEPLLRNPEPSEVIELIDNYSAKFDKAVLDANEYNMPTFETVLSEGKSALEEMAEGNLIGYGTAKECREFLSVLSNTSPADKFVICHGDLSNKNIMCYREHPIVIDWEDAFLGIKDYDLC
jgi:predicted Ser/Thr protein kinase